MRSRRKTFLIGMSALALVSILFAIELFVAERNQIVKGYGDFIIFYTGTQILRDGGGRDLYSLDLQKEYQDRFDVASQFGERPENL